MVNFSFNPSRRDRTAQLRVVFPYVAQFHQMFHSLPIATEMALRHPHIEVHVAGATPAHVQFIKTLLERHAPHAPVIVDRLKAPIVKLRGRRSKRRLLRRNEAYFRSFDALVTPERTSLHLRQLDVGNTRLIWTRHGAGDRAIGFADDIHEFDYVLMAGPKIEERLRSLGQIRPGHYTSGVYPKFDWLRSVPPVPLFANANPVVLYSPHFRPELSSWPLLGRRVLDFFAQRPQWNLVFAPHVRLFDPPTVANYREFEAYAGVPHMRIDLGSERSIDMTYVNAADLYLGDVSSQVAEFVCRPRPCLFLNAHRVDWRDDPNYRFWELGPVIEDVATLDEGLDRSVASHSQFVDAQQRYVADTFDLSEGHSSAARGADAIVSFLERDIARDRPSAPVNPAHPASPSWAQAR